MGSNLVFREMIAEKYYTSDLFRKNCFTDSHDTTLG